MKRTIVGALVCLALGVPAAVSAAAPRAERDIGGVPVLAQTFIGNSTDDRLAVLTVHGVRRVEGGTVLYYSMGLAPADQHGEAAYFDGFGNGNHLALNQPPGAAGLECVAAAIDVAGGKAYSALRVGPNGTRCIDVEDTTEFRAPADALGQARVAYTVLAPVPANVQRVDVFIDSILLQDVPVQDGVLEPVSAEVSPLVGTGWPKVSTDLIATAVQPEKAVFPLRTRVIDTTKVATTQTEKGKQLEIDASVLFTVDKATLTPAAAAVIADAAKKVTAAGPTGTITITGHTDSTNTDAYNLELSKRRAEAVATALRPQLPAGVTIRTVGKGETEPIATNSTAHGRALNRRVTITLPQ